MVRFVDCSLGWLSNGAGGRALSGRGTRQDIARRAGLDQRDDLGVAKLQISPIRWSDDGWPRLDPLPQ